MPNALAEEGAAGIFPKWSAASFPYLIVGGNTSTRRPIMVALDSGRLDANTPFTWSPFPGQAGASMKSSWLTSI